ncbi:hypothetical protein [Antarctobacter heliothermus]|uniref:Uncharacterized protein n=1 Tax=Antarctobacter heliothermus TaxID=74033 RepID=A0A239LTM7_9RHOB|nr:hypothetical protein [Antarctobacter heliothermus]SNT33725.1 hypothetical protein SAMN04488078_11018 [Antarctobacter heliothermus]
MQTNFPPTLTAPQATGHPQGLPGEQKESHAQTKVQPIADARNPEARLNDGLAPTKFWRAANGQPDPSTNAPPPSIMQITISQLLDAQSPDSDNRESRPTTDAQTDESPPTPRPYVDSVTSRDSPAADDQTAESNDARRSVLSTLP